MAGINGEEAAAHRNINHLLLESARIGAHEALEFLFKREDRQEAPMMIPTDEFRRLLVMAYGRIGEPAPPPDAELGVDHQQPAVPAAGALLLQGVTPEGDSALHVVARNGDGQDFFKCASIICGRDRSLLFATNRNGDPVDPLHTPLHCADRAGNFNMVSHLIDLAGREAASGSGDINPPLLLSVRAGSWKALKLLFDRADAQDPPMTIPTQEFLALIREPPLDPAAEQEGGGGVVVVDNQPVSLAARELLKGVTPDGGTPLHAVASSGDSEDFNICAVMICRREWDLLFAKNHNGDTPLHCAARARNSRMVSCLLALARPQGDDGRQPDGKLTLLRMQNKLHETALHEAVRIEDGRVLGPKDRRALFLGDRATAEKIRDFAAGQQEGMPIIKQLMDADSQLARYPANGISPLYLAILLQKSTIAVTLYHESGGNHNLSYSGADGQNALHVAVLRDTDKVMVELLLDWDKSLAAEMDKDRNTPLHFVSSNYFLTWPNLQQFLRFEWFPRRPTRAFPIVFRANPAAVYQADKKGYFPIHVAASVGARCIVRFFVRQCPDSAGLRNTKGKTFLHVAVEKRSLSVVSYVCTRSSLAWILNMQDNDGNTALHLAIEAKSFRMFCALLGNRKVNLNITNNQGETPRDISISKIPRGLSYSGNSENRICHALRSVRANHGALRWDKIQEKYFPIGQPQDNDDKESEKLKDTSQTLVVATALIATMAFTATFALPGGYRADDHTNGGTPTLAGRYIFDTFIMAATLAFICSILATTGFMLGAISMVNLITRRVYTFTAVILMSSSVTCLSIAFALGVYMVLAPVAPSTAVVVCVITPAILVGKGMGFLWKMVILATPLCNRKGLFLGMAELLVWCIYQMIALWPFVVIFGWGGLARIHHGR
uniref:Uncharacterized protein n=1 Tax=Avena sativa TaxID=4498 RepID=A0ACD5YCU8_AVESA